MEGFRCVSRGVICVIGRTSRAAPTLPSSVTLPKKGQARCSTSMKSRTVSTTFCTPASMAVRVALKQVSLVWRASARRTMSARWRTSKRRLQRAALCAPADVNYTRERCELVSMTLSVRLCERPTNPPYVLQDQHKGCLISSPTFLESVQTRGCTKIDACIMLRFLRCLVYFGRRLALFYALYTLYYRHTRLQVEYQSTSTNQEMAEMDSPQDEDDLDAHNDNIPADK